MVAQLVGILLLFVCPLAVAGSLSCHEMLDPVAAARNTVSELAPQLGGKTLVSDMTGGEIFRRVNAEGVIMGSNYVLFTRTDTMFIDLIKVEERFRKSGVSRLLIAEAVLRHPEVNIIKATLAWVNASAFYTALNGAALKALTEKQDGFKPNQAERDALEHTPLFKVIKSLGFTEVTSLKVHGDVIELAAERASLGK